VPRPDPELTVVAERITPGRRRPAVVIERATWEFPDFDDTSMALCR
jgi:hypothetical protein